MLQPVTKVVFIPKSKVSSGKNQTKEYCRDIKENIGSEVENVGSIPLSPVATHENGQCNHKVEEQSSINIEKTDEWRIFPQESKDYANMFKTSMHRSLWRECKDIKTLAQTNILPQRTFKNTNPRISSYEPNFVAKELRNWKEQKVTLESAEFLEKKLNRDLVQQNLKTVRSSSKSNLTFFLPKIPSKVSSSQQSCSKSTHKQLKLTNISLKDCHRNCNTDCNVDCNKPKVVFPNIPGYANKSLLDLKEQKYLNCNSNFPFETCINRRMWNLFNSTLPSSHRRKNLLLDWYASGTDRHSSPKDKTVSSIKQSIPSWLTKNVEDNIEIIGTQAFYHSKHKYFHKESAWKPSVLRPCP